MQAHGWTEHRLFQVHRSGLEHQERAREEPIMLHVISSFFHVPPGAFWLASPSGFMEKSSTCLVEDVCMPQFPARLVGPWVQYGQSAKPLMSLIWLTSFCTGRPWEALWPPTRSALARRLCFLFRCSGFSLFFFASVILS